jgi:hypothetical protein
VLFELLLLAILIRGALVFIVRILLRLENPVFQQVFPEICT